MDKVTLNLSDEERKRNRHKPMLQYDYSELDQGPFEIPDYEKLEEVYCTEIRVSQEEVSNALFFISNKYCIRKKNLHIYNNSRIQNNNLNFGYHLTHG